MSWNLKKLLTDSGVHPPPGADSVTIDALSYDSRRAAAGSLFFAVPGVQADGAKFAADAVTRGASAVVSTTPVPACPVPVALVPEARIAMADIARTFYGDPAASLRCVGITGTNGKTTTAFLTKHLLDSAHLRCGLLGTIRYIVGDETLPAARTTPESVDVQALLARMAAAANRSVAMEVSSHALVQHRVRGVEWDAAIFTNLTQDHLDYHKTMDAYFDAKAKLFSTMFEQTSKRGKAIVNLDDRYGTFLLERFPKAVKPITYGLGVHADFRAVDPRSDVNGTQYKLEAKGRQYLVRLPLIGRFNVYNSLAALAAASALGLELRAAVQAMADAPQVPGRLERVPARRNFSVYVDYAHTDDALTNVLSTLRDLRPRRLLVVFGCGGDRDRAKRPLMARAAGQLADYTIVTSDNPRSEDPEAIISDILPGLHNKAFETITDRRDAIHRAIALAESGDIVLIAGKGHETYQEVHGKRTPFDDVSVARNAIEAKPVEIE
ncbi:MAG TPA: UDP-N-acetylmuramoyl-L-alanyl-D-glutamate--2,6-diaminopimelate ligase [Chthoniobacterales bacterium]|nr:UDP-N-acetylmuramoyl-L-alanyl-D-glutamate--2,6-diaminopimelate ligase [Chthoniobacterales bacterium]